MEQPAKNRLSALSGFPVKDTLQGLAKGNRVGKPAERKQEILTPQKILGVPQRLWGRIALDPCWCKGALTNPIHKFEFPYQDGLKEKWVAQTFINPHSRTLRSGWSTARLNLRSRFGSARFAPTANGGGPGAMG